MSITRTPDSRADSKSSVIRSAGIGFSRAGGFRVFSGDALGGAPEGELEDDDEFGKPAAMIPCGTRRGVRPAALGDGVANGCAAAAGDAADAPRATCAAWAAGNSERLSSPTVGAGGA